MGRYYTPEYSKILQWNILSIGYKLVRVCITEGPQIVTCYYSHLPLSARA